MLAVYRHDFGRYTSDTAIVVIAMGATSALLEWKQDEAPAVVASEGSKALRSRSRCGGRRGARQSGMGRLVIADDDRAGLIV